MSARVSKTAFVLLGLMTALTVIGPLLIAATIQGGQDSHWPPDRPVEWWTFGLVTGAVVILMGFCLAIGIGQWRQLLAAKPESPRKDAR